MADADGPGPVTPSGWRALGRPVGPLLALLAVGLISVNLRPGASSVGPVLEEVVGDLGIGAGTAGAMTALPGLCFRLVGGVAVALGRRLGLAAGIGVGLAAAAVGLVGRALSTSVPLFLALTALALGGMAVGNVLVPAWVKRNSEDGGVRLMTVFSSGLTLGGAVGAGLAAPLAAGVGWRASLGVWGVVVLLALGPWVLLAARAPRPGAEDVDAAAEAPDGRLTGSRTAVSLATFFGLQAMNAYVQFGWLPQIYRDAGLSPTHAGLLMALLMALGVLGGLTMPTVIARSAIRASAATRPTTPSFHEDRPFEPIDRDSRRRLTPHEPSMR